MWTWIFGKGAWRVEGMVWNREEGLLEMLMKANKGESSLLWVSVSTSSREVSGTGGLFLLCLLRLQQDWPSSYPLSSSASRRGSLPPL